MHIKSIVTFCGIIFGAFAHADYCPAPGTSFEHSLSVKVDFDRKSNLYTYTYQLGNGRQSLVPIKGWYLAVSDPSASVSASQLKWRSRVEEQSGNDPASIRWFTVESSAKPDPKRSEQSQVGAPDAAIKPGQTLGGFTLKTNKPPGVVQYYVDGFQELPVAYTTADSPDPDLNCPNIDTENPLFRSIVTGVTVGPQNPNVMSVKMRLRKYEGRERCGPFEPKAPKGEINLVVFSTKEFDATQIDTNTVKFGPDEVAPISSKVIPASFGNFSKDEDEEWERQHEAYRGRIDGGQRKNLMMTFDVAALGIQCGLDKALFLNAKTLDGKIVLGGVSAKTVGCDVRKPGKRKNHRKNHDSGH